MSKNYNNTSRPFYNKSRFRPNTQNNSHVIEKINQPVMTQDHQFLAKNALKPFVAHSMRRKWYNNKHNWRNIKKGISFLDRDVLLTHNIKYLTRIKKQKFSNYMANYYVKSLRLVKPFEKSTKSNALKYVNLQLRLRAQFARRSSLFMQKVLAANTRSLLRTSLQHRLGSKLRMGVQLSKSIVLKSAQRSFFNHQLQISFNHQFKANNRSKRAQRWNRYEKSDYLFNKKRLYSRNKCYYYNYFYKLPHQKWNKKAVNLYSKKTLKLSTKKFGRNTLSNVKINPQLLRILRQKKQLLQFKTRKLFYRKIGLRSFYLNVHVLKPKNRYWFTRNFITHLNEKYKLNIYRVAKWNIGPFQSFLKAHLATRLQNLSAFKSRLNSVIFKRYKYNSKGSETLARPFMKISHIHFMKFKRLTKKFDYRRYFGPKLRTFKKYVYTGPDFKFDYSGRAKLLKTKMRGKASVKFVNFHRSIKNLYASTSMFNRLSQTLKYGIINRRRAWNKKWYATKLQIKVKSVYNLLQNPKTGGVRSKLRKKDLFKIKHHFSTTLIPFLYGKQSLNHLHIKQSYSNVGNSAQNYLWYFERQLASLLVRAKYVPTIKAAAHLVRYGQIAIENKIKFNPFMFLGLLQVARLVNLQSYVRYLTIYLGFSHSNQRKNICPNFIERNLRILAVSLVTIPHVQDYTNAYSFINFRNRAFYRSFDLIANLF